MAEKTLNDLDKMDSQQRSLYRAYKEDLDNHDSAIVDFDAYEAMDMGKTYDTVSKKTGNGLTDNMTATIYLERAARVAGQVPEGETVSFGKMDYGKAQFLDLLRTKWINPNANSQFDLLTKFFMWQYGSSEYNLMPMHYDIVVNEATGYIGPDCWLWNPRNFIPQTGFTSVTDMDYAHGITYQSATWFEDILDDEEDDTYDKAEIKKLLSKLKDATTEADVNRDTLSYRTRTKQSTRKIMIATRYEAGKDGHWISFLPEYGCVVIRDIKNPHKNARIPFILKRCIPKLDDYYGNGDFQRSMPMQFANDGLDNFYFQGIKVNLFPALMINMQTAIRHTISSEPGAVMEFNGSPDAKRLETSNAGLSTYQAAKGMAKGAIQSIAGTTDTRSNSEDTSDPAFGKTPEALKQIKEREGTRDNFDRGILERAIAELYEAWYSILPTIAGDIPVDLLAKDIEEIIQSGATDLGTMFTYWEAQGNLKHRMSESGNQMRIKIKPEAFEGIRNRFDIKPNSTVKGTKEQQIENIQLFWDFIGKVPNALQQYQEATGKVPDWEYTLGQMGKLLELPFLDKMFTQAPVPPQAQAPVQGATPPTGAPTGEAPAMEGAPQPQMGGMPQGMPEMGGQLPIEEEAPMLQAPQEMQQPQQPPMPNFNPAILRQIAQASPQNPVQLGSYQFTDPAEAMEAYRAVVEQGLV